MLRYAAPVTVRQEFMTVRQQWMGLGSSSHGHELQVAPRLPDLAS